MSTFKKIMTRLTVLFVLSSTFYSLPVFATEGQTDAEVAATTDLREETRDVIPEAEVNTENEQPPLEEVESEAEETEKESADLQKVVQQSESENKTDQQAAFYATVKEIDPEDYQQGRILNLREESDSKKVTANWHLVTDGRREYPLLVQFNNYNNSFKTTKITVDIPRGVMVAKADLEAIKNNPDSPVTDYEIHQTPGQQEVINTYATNLKETVEINPNSQSNKYLYGVTLTFHLDLGTSLLVTKGFILPLRTIYDDRFKNFWSGVTGSSLTRNLPINVNLIEDEEFKKTLILDDILIEAEASFQNITRDPANSASNVPGVQVLKETNEVIVQPRLRNNTENPGSNSYYMGNPAFDVYVPYKAGSSGKYISATVDTQAMDDWLSELKKLNNGKDIMKYTIRATDDGRNIVKYEFVDDTQEFMLLVVDLSLFYIFPEEKFDYGDTVLFPRDSIGWYLKNYQYNEHGERQLVESARKAIGDSATKVQLVDPGSFDFSLSSTSSYKPIFTDTQKSTSLLGYVQLANHSDYEGQARASFEFDVHNTWNYGVTTVQYWAVDQSYGNEKNSIVPSQNYTYSFNYVLQKRGSVGEENQIQGVHQLTPADAYKDDIITRADGYKHKLLNYANKVGDTHPQRFFYYVNREMLVSELSAEQLPVDFDISDYFIKKLSYEFDVKGGYMSGNSGRIKEGGGQFYGYQFGSSGKSMDSKWSIEGLTGSNRDTQVRDFKTTSQKKTSNGSDTALFLNSTSTPMKITDENGKVLTVDSPRIKEGEKINISASALACFYPYGNTSYAPDPVF